MPHVANCASTCANHTSGSEGQKGGSLRLTAVFLLSALHSSVSRAMCNSRRSRQLLAKRMISKYPTSVHTLQDTDSYYIMNWEKNLEFAHGSSRSVPGSVQRSVATVSYPILQDYVKPHYPTNFNCAQSEIHIWLVDRLLLAPIDRRSNGVVK